MSSNRFFKNKIFVIQLTIIALMFSSYFAKINSLQVYPTQSTYAIGAIDMTYQNYALYTFPSSDIQNFINSYNNVGGLPSLGYTNQYNCLLNMEFNGLVQSSCNCPQTTTSGEIISLKGQGQIYCENTLVAIEPVTVYQSQVGLAVYISTLDPSCNSLCYLHGECFNGNCICDNGWNGTDCQSLIVPKGYLSSVYTIIWKQLFDEETLQFSLNSDKNGNANCTMYLYQMPSQYTFGPIVPVSDFSFQELIFSFYLDEQEDQISMMIYIIYPEKATYCSASSFMGRTSTTGQISFAGGLPQYIDSNFLLNLPGMDV
eukprot:TRINITY_DN15681_c0_g1_i1.p1 TRINITY_DN15681_c0_g1~~TRINITY_DN15681_c0_g1_i1.p1  ORF type:complete len:315 (-),score=6.04 TRINITY_DN15681_c0_g1_i1:188-1132(-)